MITKKVLCVDKKDLVKAPNLQKDKEYLEKVFRGFKFIEEDEMNEDYVPLDIAITIRSAYTNKVVMCKHSDSDGERCFFNLTKIPPVHHTGYDLIMFISSIAVMKMCDPVNAQKVTEVMMHSKFDFLGLLNLEPDLVNPIMYSHVILEDNTVEQFESLLAEGFRVISIEDIPEKGTFKAIKESLIICKPEEGDTKDEQSNNN